MQTTKSTLPTKSTLQPDFLDWVLKTQFDFQGKAREEFVVALKADPERVETFIRNGLPRWSMMAALQLSTGIVVSDYGQAVGEIFEEVKKHYLAD